MFKHICCFVGQPKTYNPKCFSSQIQASDNAKKQTKF